MSCTLKSRTRDFYVELTANGDYSLPVALEILTQAFELAEEQDRPAALVDVSKVSGSPDQLDNFEIGNSVQKAQFAQNKIISMALVVSHSTIDSHRFLETVAINRCAVFRVFEDKDAAITWLDSTAE